MKFPAQLFNVLPAIESARIDGPLDPVDVDLPEDYQPPGKKAPMGHYEGTRSQAQRRRRTTVARRCERRTTRTKGTDYAEVGKPYDIRVTVQGVLRRCEVKGSSMEIDTVELTFNEVEHGTAYTPVDLIVVDRIMPVRDSETGEVTGATGGRHRV